MSADDDQVNLTGGTNELNTGTGDDQVTVSGGNNTINTDTGNDQITISGGTNTFCEMDDTLSLSAGILGLVMIQLQHLPFTEFRWWFWYRPIKYYFHWNCDFTYGY